MLLKERALNYYLMEDKTIEEVIDDCLKHFKDHATLFALQVYVDRNPNDEQVKNGIVPDYIPSEELEKQLEYFAEGSSPKGSKYPDSDKQLNLDELVYRYSKFISYNNKNISFSIEKKVHPNLNAMRYDNNFKYLFGEGYTIPLDIKIVRVGNHEYYFYTVGDPKWCINRDPNFSCIRLPKAEIGYTKG